LTVKGHRDTRESRNKGGETPRIGSGEEGEVRQWRIAAAMTWFQRLLILTIGLTFVLVVIGGTVRATGSGLGCPDWPMCHGQVIPPAEKHTLIEFSHRTAASIVGFVFLGVTYFAFKTERRNTLVFWLAFSAGLLLVGQIILGGITVKKELPPEIVAAHLGTAMAFIGVLIVTATVSLALSRGTPVVRGALASNYTRLAMVTAGVAFATLVLGSYISNTNAALACDGWPLCNGSAVPRGDSAVGLHWLHRLVAGVLGLLLVATIWAAFDERRGRAVQWVSMLAGVVYITQALVGAANIWTELREDVVVTHLTLAALLWCMLVALSAVSFYVPGVARESEARSRQREGKATEWAR
jgi:heme A synthase